MKKIALSLAVLGFVVFANATECQVTYKTASESDATSYISKIAMSKGNCVQLDQIFVNNDTQEYHTQTKYLISDGKLGILAISDDGQYSESVTSSSNRLANDSRSYVREYAKKYHYDVLDYTKNDAAVGGEPLR